MTKEKYINDVLNYVNVDRKTKKRIKEDLEMRIDDALDQDPYFDLVESMGKPVDLANEFMANMGIEQVQPLGRAREYVSKTKIFGIPLVHVNLSAGRGTAVAKGIVAIGDIAIGVVAMGGASFGVIALGGLSVGIAALGGVAIGGFVAGGVALGLYALGGVAVGLMKAFGAATNMM